MNTQNKKERLIESAAVLFHKNGLMATSLADIAKHAEIPIGNVYYYFKTKDDLALAAILKRKEQLTATYLMLMENINDPRERLIESVGYFKKVYSDYVKYGCPIGKIISDADTEKDPVAQTAASIIADFVSWAGAQFEMLGHTQAAEKYATSLMAGLQGAALMAKTFQNPAIIADEATRLTAWLETIPNRKIHLGKAGIRPAGNAA